MTRRAANLGWLAVGTVVALELAWCARDGLPHWTFGPNVAISASEFVTPRGKFGLTTGTTLQPGRRLDETRLGFVVIEGPVRELEGNYRGGDRVVFGPPNTGIMWLPVTRTKRIDVNVSPPQLYHVHGTEVERVALPRNFTRKDLGGFLAAPEAADGAVGFRRWVAGRSR